MTDPAPGSAPAAAAGPPPAKRSLRRRVLGHPLTHLCAALVILGLVQGFLVKLFQVPSGSMEQTLEVGDRLLVNRLAYALPGAAPANGDIVVFSTREELWPSGREQSDPGLLDALKHAVKFVAGDLIGIGPTTSHMLVKRVIGTPGQTVECCGVNGGLVVDGEELDEPYIYEDLPFSPGALDCEGATPSTRCFPPLTVPEGKLLVLGDHRGGSSDGVSLCRGLVDASEGAAGDGDGSCARWVDIDDVIGETLAVVWPLDRFGGVSG